MTPIDIQIQRTINEGNYEDFVRLLTTHPEFVREPDGSSLWLGSAAGRGLLPFVQWLTEHGADINGPTAPGDPEGVIVNAAGEGQVEVARWLLDHGAKLNFEVDSKPRCLALSHAVMSGNLEMVRLLVERGAAFNTTWGGVNPLSMARDYDKKEIEAYLRSQGAKLPYELIPRDVPGGHRAILRHVTSRRGKPRPLTLPSTSSGDPSVVLYVVEPKGDFDCRTVFTLGMSDCPVKLRNGGDAFLELVIHLPTDWSINEKALTDSRYRWPLEWLLQIAATTNERGEWPGEPDIVFANGDPPQPLAPNTKLSCMMCVMDYSSFGYLQLPDFRPVNFFGVYAIYTEERDLEKEKGTQHLIELFQQHNIPLHVDLQRPNVALLETGR